MSKNNDQPQTRRIVIYPHIPLPDADKAITAYYDSDAWERAKPQLKEASPYGGVHYTKLGETYTIGDMTLLVYPTPTTIVVKKIAVAIPKVLD